MFRTLFCFNFCLLFFAIPALAQVSDPILTDEPEQNRYEDRKKQEIQKVIESAKNDAVSQEGDMLFYVPEFSFSLTGGLGYGNYALKNNLPNTTSARSQDYGPIETQSWLLNASASYVNTLKSFEITAYFRHLSGSNDSIRGFNPQGTGTLESIRQRFGIDAYWTDIWKGFFLKLGYAVWKRDGTQTRPRAVMSFFRAHGPSIGTGYNFEISRNHGISFRPLFVFDFPLSFSEFSGATGTQRTHFGSELNLRLRWKAWTSIAFELAPFIRYEYTHYALGTFTRITRQPTERDISFGIPVGIVYSF